MAAYVGVQAQPARQKYPTVGTMPKPTNAGGVAGTSPVNPTAPKPDLSGTIVKDPNGFGGFGGVDPLQGLPGAGPAGPLVRPGMAQAQPFDSVGADPARTRLINAVMQRFTPGKPMGQF